MPRSPDAVTLVLAIVNAGDLLPESPNTGIMIRIALSKRSKVHTNDNVVGTVVNLRNIEGDGTLVHREVVGKRMCCTV